MARSTKRKTKHRGNAAGIVEVRGRTGRAPTATEKGKTPTKTQARVNRLDQPPTWRSSFNRAVIAGVIVLAASTFLLKGMTVGRAAALLPLILVIYVPLGYYTDRFMYERRQRKKAGKK